jgi:hypothetical protein
MDQPGKLSGKWLRSLENVNLTIEPRQAKNTGDSGAEAPAFSEDDFTMSVDAGTNRLSHDFTAAYGRFCVYPIDIDGKGVDFIAIQRGEGRGTSVYVESLEILKCSKTGFTRLFDADLNGYIWNPDVRDVVSWERRYLWTRSKRKNVLGLELRLVPSPLIPKNCGPETTLYVLQHPKLAFGFDAEGERFEIVREEFQPLGKFYPKPKGKRGSED